MQGLDSTAGIVAVVAVAIAAIALLLALAALLRLRRIGAAQRAVLGAGGPQDLVGHALETRRQIEELRAGVGAMEQALIARLEQAERRLDGSISRAGAVRYDAFNESTGRQSSSVALLDERGDGVVISAILQREQARVYAKPIADRDSELELSPEEQEAIRLAEENAVR